jgi:hypothetical protein
MRKTEECISWVVYRTASHGKAKMMNAVCEQREWDSMERAQPGHYTLVQAGMTNEGEAEQLARNTPADGDTSKPAEIKFPSR